MRADSHRCTTPMAASATASIRARNASLLMPAEVAPGDGVLVDDLPEDQRREDLDERRDQDRAQQEAQEQPVGAGEPPHPPDDGPVERAVGQHVRVAHPVVSETEVAQGPARLRPGRPTRPGGPSLAAGGRLRAPGGSLLAIAVAVAGLGLRGVVVLVGVLEVASRLHAVGPGRRRASAVLGERVVGLARVAEGGAGQVASRRRCRWTLLIALSVIGLVIKAVRFGSRAWAWCSPWAGRWPGRR